MGKLLIIHQPELRPYYYSLSPCHPPAERKGRHLLHASSPLRAMVNGETDIPGVGHTNQPDMSERSCRLQACDFKVQAFFCAF